MWTIILTLLISLIVIFILCCPPSCIWDYCTWAWYQAAKRDEFLFPHRTFLQERPPSIFLGGAWSPDTNLQSSGSILKKFPDKNCVRMSLWIGQIRIIWIPKINSLLSTPQDSDSCPLPESSHCLGDLRYSKQSMELSALLLWAFLPSQT